MNTSVLHRSRWLRNSLLALMLVSLGIGAWILVHRAHQSHDHAHPDEAAAVMTLNVGRRWETDLPLRTGMQGENIRESAACTGVPCGRP